MAHFPLIGETSGAVAPTLALSLVALISAGGVAFDYARMASLDTELQNAADQAALAAASQLDGEAGACARAAAAASNMVANFALMANDGGTTAIDVDNEAACDAAGNVRFYQNITKTTPATDDSNARFVEVTVNPRRANFAFTPIVAAFTSGDLVATAFAGLDSAICKVPPLMLCNPRESTDPDFDVSLYVGKGIRLVANDGGGIYGPGNFGFLDTNPGGGGGAAVLRQILGRNAIPGDCVSGDGVTTEPGNMISVRDALNTRMDVYDNGLNQACGGNGALCPPSTNSRKDLLRRGNGQNACGFVTGGGGNGWREAANAYPNLPTSTTPRALTDTEIGTVPPMGYPRDICHAFSVIGSCPLDRVGTGTWDRYAYFRSNSTNYGSITSSAAMSSYLNATFGTTTPSRYQVYLNEMANAASRLQQQSAGGGLMAHGSPVCGGSGIAPSETQIDRRVLSAAVVNCTAEGVRGRTSGIAVVKWIDLFLTEPSVTRARTENSDIYVEVIGATQNATDEGAVQLVKKSIPYLIE